MKIAVGIPNTIKGMPGHLFPAWARAAESWGFSTLGTIGRIAYDNYEELVTLAAASAVTERIGLMTTVLLGPVRETALLAKQSATLDRLSAGRFTLGLGLGAREEDYTVTGAEYRDRGSQLEEQVSLIKEIWDGRKVRGAEHPIGPRPQWPRLVLSGRAETAIARAGRVADGFIATPVPVPELSRQFDLVRQAWRENQRKGKPYLAASRYVVLDPDLVPEAESNVRDYYGFGGQEFIETILEGMLRTPESVRQAIDEIASLGTDELFLWPVTAHLQELHRLAEARGDRGLKP